LTLKGPHGRSWRPLGLSIPVRRLKWIFRLICGACGANRPGPELAAALSGHKVYFAQMDGNSVADSTSALRADRCVSEEPRCREGRRYPLGLFMASPSLNLYGCPKASQKLMT